MMEDLDASNLFTMAPAALEGALPERVSPADPDEARIRLSSTRYAQIEIAVLELYRDVDARFVPLEPLSIAQELGYGPIPYRALGAKISRLLHAASPDALTCWFWGEDRPLILFDDRKPRRRCAFTMMHEIAHARLGHREHSELAEMEANKFAAEALCPLPLLSRSGLVAPEKISEHFGVSEECARHRLDALAKWNALPGSRRNRLFAEGVLGRFRFKIPIQGILFPAKGCG